MPQPKPSIDGLDFQALTELRDEIESRLTAIRADFVEKAAAFGLSVVDGDAKRRKRRAGAAKEQD